MSKSVTLTIEADMEVLDALESILDDAREARVDRVEYLERYGHLDYTPAEMESIAATMARDAEFSSALMRQVVSRREELQRTAAESKEV